jgi:hypothetical protein
MSWENRLNVYHKKYQSNMKQVEKLSRKDEQSAFLTGGVSNVTKFTFSFRKAKKKFFFIDQLKNQKCVCFSSLREREFFHVFVIEI